MNVYAVGYYALSLMNKFGCAQGFREGFGLIHVDMEPDKHTLKDYAKWYRNLIATNGSEL
jgi:beta-glucosidase